MENISVEEDGFGGRPHQLVLSREITNIGDLIKIESFKVVEEQGEKYLEWKRDSISVIP
jgi:hypothetical protein